jgi:tRNA pseudouridine38-40 synthase
MRVKLTLAYDGTHFLGSQQQKETTNTILGTLKKVFSRLGIESKIVASGRTDKGVHASGQVCHIDLPPFWSDPKKLKIVVNRMLPSSILIRDIVAVNDEFHARYSAKKRVYRYILKEQESNPFERNFITFLENIEFQKIEKNIKLFQGVHDFAYFLKSGSDEKSTIREIYSAFAYKHNGYIVLHFEANGFLRSQIRLMVGALLTFDAEKIQEKLLCQKNHKLKPAPSNGLYLARIKY